MGRRDPADSGPAHRRRVLLEARAEIDRELAQLGARLPPLARQDGPGRQEWGPDDAVTLKRAAGAWGLTYQGARLRAEKLAPLGLAVKLRLGGWRVRVEVLSEA